MGYGQDSARRHCIASVLDHGVPLDKIADAPIERIHGFETRGFDCRIGHDIVPPIKILVDESIEKHEVGVRDDPVGAVGGWHQSP